jgi:predicted O-methyltransferase YrrM
MLNRFNKKNKASSAEIPLPCYPVMSQRVKNTCYPGKGGVEWYPPVMLSAESLAEKTLQSTYALTALRLIQRLDMDDYCKYLEGYYQEGIKRYGDNWRYADIVTVLLSLSQTLQPESYLEIGVRRGRSVCAVASMMPTCNIYMFDMWVTNYAGMDNPGENLVQSELLKFGHTGKRQFYNGNSHQTLKTFFKANSSLAFDIITVDGDHSYAGAAEDLCDVLPHIKIGGAIVFDDLCHPKHMYLREIWQRLVVDDPRFTSWTSADIGYGVGFALRKW